MSKVHELILKMNSILDPNHQKNVESANAGVSSITENVKKMSKEHSELKAINLEINNYEKTTSSLSNIKEYQNNLTKEIEKYQIISQREDKSSEKYLEAQKKIKVLTGEYKKTETQITKLDVKQKMLNENLEKNGISTKNLSNSKTELRTRMNNLGTSIKQTTDASKRQSNEIEKQAKSQNALSSSMKKLIGLGAAYFSIGKIKGFYSESLALAKDQLKAETDLGAMLMNNKHLKGDSAAVENAKKSLMSYASELQELGVIGDEVTIAGQAQLATFQLQPETMKTLSVGMLDMIAKNKGFEASQGDAVTTANLLGKVMSGQVGALGRYGVSFSETQEKVLKFGTEQQRAAMLAEVLQENYGGANKALAETPLGVIQNFKNAWGDMKEEVGKEVLPGLSELYSFAKTQIPAIQNSIVGVTRIVMQGGEIFLRYHKVLIVGAGVYATYKGAKLGVSLVQKGIDAWKIAKTIPLKTRELYLNNLSTASEIKKKAVLFSSMATTKGYTATQWLLNAAMTANPIGAVVVGVAALAGGLAYAYKKSEVFRNVINGLWDSVTSILKPFQGLQDRIEGISNIWNRFRGKDEKNTITTDVIVNEKTNQQAVGGIDYSSLPKYAKGGLVDRPQIAIVGEGGDKEMIIPINSSKRSQSLFIQAGNMLGLGNNFQAPSQGKEPKNIPKSINNIMNKTLLEFQMPNKKDLFANIDKIFGKNTENTNINENKSDLKIEININVNGDISKEKAVEIGEKAGEGFERKLQEMERKRGRLSFG